LNPAAGDPDMLKQTGIASPTCFSQNFTHARADSEQVCAVEAMLREFGTGCSYSAIGSCGAVPQLKRSASGCTDVRQPRHFENWRVAQLASGLGRDEMGAVRRMRGTDRIEVGSMVSAVRNVSWKSKRVIIWRGLKTRQRGATSVIANWLMAVPSHINFHRLT